MAVPATTDPIFEIPETTVDEMYQKVLAVKIEDLTTGAINGTGAFDKLMASVKQHLQAEYEIGRITGNEYTKAYIEMSNAALQTALQFVLGREQAFWAAQTAQIQAVTARVALEAAKYNYDNLLPIQKDTAQVALDTARYNYDYMLPLQRDTALFNLNQLQPAQVALITAQRLLVREQTEVQHAQFSDFLLDGVTTVRGVMGSQKDLYRQQITSYQRDAEVKAARIFTDAWITQKTIDDGLLAPDNFTNNSVNGVLGVIKANNGLI